MNRFNLTEWAIKRRSVVISGWATQRPGDEPFCLGKPVSVAGAWRLALQPNHPSPRDGF